MITLTLENSWREIDNLTDRMRLKIYDVHKIFRAIVPIPIGVSKEQLSEYIKGVDSTPMNHKIFSQKFNYKDWKSAVISKNDLGELRHQYLQNIDLS